MSDRTFVKLNRKNDVPVVRYSLSEPRCRCVHRPNLIGDVVLTFAVVEYAPIQSVSLGRVLKNCTVTTSSFDIVSGVTFVNKYSPVVIARIDIRSGLILSA